MASWTVLDALSPARECHPARDHPESCVPSMSWHPHPPPDRSPEHLQHTPSPGWDEHPRVVSAAPAVAQMETLTGSLIPAFFPDALASPAPSPLAHRPCQGGSRPWGPGSPAAPLLPSLAWAASLPRAEPHASACINLPVFLPAQDKFFCRLGVFKLKMEFPHIFACHSGGPLLSHGPGAGGAAGQCTHLPGRPSDGSPRLQAPVQSASRGGKS